MKNAVSILSITFASLSFAQSFAPFAATLKETAPLNKTSDITTPAILHCQPLAGTTVNVIAQAAMTGIPQFVSQVEVQDGQCKGAVGWIITSRLASR